MRRIHTILAALLATGLVLANSAGWAQQKRVVKASRVNRSIPLAEMAAAPAKFRGPYAVPNKLSQGRRPGPNIPGFADPLLQSQAPTLLAATISQSFEGTSDDDNENVVGFRVVPPDTEGDVGPNHYVQWNNLVAEIFDKSGNSLMGPFPGNMFFQGLGGACENTNDGDPVVRYDALADRWMVSQFAVDGGPPFFECVAVSATSNPMGAYNQYEFSFGTDFPDYPKLGVWPDAYYMTTRNFANGSSFTGVQAVAFERAQMINGDPAQMIVFDVPGGTANDGWLPADHDGGPAPATPGLFAGAPSTTGSNQIQIYALAVDWVTPANSTLSLIATLPTAPFDTSISTVPQRKPGDNLDALSQFLMFPMQHRDFGTHRTLMLNHTVDVGGNRAGIRWYELRDEGIGWFIHQQGTFAPDDGLHRWVGSIVMNGDGDIALGYTVSSRDVFPSIRFTGQTADQSGTGVMNVAEEIIVAGGGSQQQSFGRWGDYSASSVDPSDDVTFWHTNEYYANAGSFDFSTRIAAFSFFTGTPTDVHVESIVTGTENVGQGNKRGTATVTIQDDVGNLVSGAMVFGTFSGDFNEMASGTTGPDGTVTLVTVATQKGNVNFSFCVDNVIASLPYDPNDNPDPSFACP